VKHRQVIDLRTLFSLLFLLVFSGVITAEAQSPPNIDSLMTKEDFKASGLDKLSDAERAHLSGWLERYRQGAIKAPLPKDVKRREEQAMMAASSPAAESSEAASSTASTASIATTASTASQAATVEPDEKRKFLIVAKVLPGFKGWLGKTVFRLDNGQTWQQRTTGTLRYSGSESTVRITKNFIGKYMMKHEDSGRSVGVKRVE
jgi:hypothetical protein